MNNGFWDKIPLSVIDDMLIISPRRGCSSVISLHCQWLYAQVVYISNRPWAIVFVSSVFDMTNESHFHNITVIFLSCWNFLWKFNFTKRVFCIYEVTVFLHMYLYIGERIVLQYFGIKLARCGIKCFMIFEERLVCL